MVLNRGQMPKAQRLAMLICTAGAGASLGLMYKVGHRNPSFVLILLFTIWVLSPFVGLLVGAFISERWAAPFRASFFEKLDKDIHLHLAEVKAYKTGKVELHYEVQR